MTNNGVVPRPCKAAPSARFLDVLGSQFVQSQRRTPIRDFCALAEGAHLQYSENERWAVQV